MMTSTIRIPLLDYLKIKGLTKDAFAKKLKVSPALVSRWAAVAAAGDPLYVVATEKSQSPRAVVTQRQDYYGLTYFRQLGEGKGQGKRLEKGDDK